jgi:hypothetical protein
LCFLFSVVLYQGNDVRGYKKDVEKARNGNGQVEEHTRELERCIEIRACGFRNEVTEIHRHDAEEEKTYLYEDIVKELELLGKALIEKVYVDVIPSSDDDRYREESRPNEKQSCHLFRPRQGSKRKVAGKYLEQSQQDDACKKQNSHDLESLSQQFHGFPRRKRRGLRPRLKKYAVYRRLLEPEKQE